MARAFEFLCGIIISQVIIYGSFKEPAVSYSCQSNKTNFFINPHVAGDYTMNRIIYPGPVVCLIALLLFFSYYWLHTRRKVASLLGYEPVS